MAKKQKPAEKEHEPSMVEKVLEKVFGDHESEAVKPAEAHAEAKQKKSGPSGLQKHPKFDKFN